MHAFSEFSNLTVVDHPLIRHKLGLLRAATTPKKLFGELVDELSMLMAYEVTRGLEEREVEIETPLERTTARAIVGQDLVVVPILRAGLGMARGFLRLIPTARVGHVGVARNEESLEPVEYYYKVPDSDGEADRGRFIVLDPMLATGGSASATIARLKERGARHVVLMCLVAAPEGVRALAAAHPDVHVFAAALDRELNAAGYILPGLGDAGDRLFGTT
jgi:uracil phosphoribosyltransferase